MTKKNIPHEESEASQNPLAEELLEVLLQEEDYYPWNPADPDAEEYFTELEESFSLVDALGSVELDNQAETFFAHLHQCWPSPAKSNLRTALVEQFGSLLPIAWLETIIEQAERSVSQNLQPINQVVECIKPLWSSWTEADLQLLARPLVYAMRGTTPSKEVAWDELSEVDKIRLSMAVAQDVLEQVQASQS